MSILCLWSPILRTAEGAVAELVPLLLEEAPRVVVESRGVVWVDVRGLVEGEVASRVLERLVERGVDGVRGGVATVPIVAEGAARFGAGPLEGVKAGKERDFLASLPLDLVAEDERLLGLLEGAGVRRCGELAELTAEAVEVRFGSEGVRAWQLSRGEDPRILFRPIPPERPLSAVDFIDYTVRDATRLVFTLNALLDQICGTLRSRAHRASSITLSFQLSGGSNVHEVLRTARPTADRALWLRRLRTALERVRLTQPISGVSLEVTASEPISGLQGDLFDRGFATAVSVEEAVTRLMDLYHGLFVRQESVPDPLAERRVRWVELLPEEVAASGPAGRNGVPVGPESRPTGAEEHPGRVDMEGRDPPPALELQLLSDPRPIRVRHRIRRDHVIPIRYFENGRWQSLTSAGPDRISGAHEEARPYAREYYRCVSDAGALVWIYRDAIEDRWYLHGWWE